MTQHAPHVKQVAGAHAASLAGPAWRLVSAPECRGDVRSRIDGDLAGVGSSRSLSANGKVRYSCVAGPLRESSMVNPKEIWMVQPCRTLCTESLGFELCVQGPTQMGRFRFTVRNRPDLTSGLSSVLVAGDLPSAMQAMAAAERAAAALSCRQPGRPSLERQPRPPGQGAAHQRGTSSRVPGGPEHEPAGGGLLVQRRRITVPDVLALSDA